MSRLKQILLIFFLVAVSFAGGYITHIKIEKPVQTESDTIERVVHHWDVDTLWKVLPMPLLTRTLRETITITDSVGYIIEVPVEQKVYEDSTFTAYVSGVRPRLDSIRVYQKTEFFERTREITKYKKWTFGLQGGLYITPKGIQPGIGGGVTYNF